MVEIAQNLVSTRRGSVLVGAAAAVIAAIVLLVYLHNYRNSVSGDAVSPTVLVAKNLIQKGTSGDIVGSSDQFEVTSVPKEQLQAAALTDPVALKGRVAVTDIYPGQQLTAAAFVPAAPDALGNKITGDERAISISIDAQHGMIGQIAAGDHIDVFVGLNSQGIAGNQPVIKLLLKDVSVLRAPGSGGSGMYTLKVGGVAAAALAYASDNGRLWFVLRPPSGAKPFHPGLVTAQTLLLGLKGVH